MRRIALIITLTALMGCSDDELSYVSIRNETALPIYALPYSSEYSDGEWIQPGVTDEFFSIGINPLDGFEYFSIYYDSLIVYVKGHNDKPLKFYKDGTTINYDPTLNPFTNPEVWSTRAYNKHLPVSGFESLEEKQIYEDYFSIDPEAIISLTDSVATESDPAK
ncbi:MAG: hypothetical protein GY790_18570 [Bacteroidetes bacterium]|nr:hypothetical protein [Bacteroidota bacterium]